MARLNLWPRAHLIQSYHLTDEEINVNSRSGRVWFPGSSSKAFLSPSVPWSFLLVSHQIFSLSSSVRVGVFFPDISSSEAIAFPICLLILAALEQALSAWCI